MPYVYFDPDYNKIPTYSAVKNNVENVTDIGELTDTITEPTLNKTLPKFEVVLYTGSSTGSTSTQTKFNGYTLTRGSNTSNGDITAVSNQQIKSWVNNGLYLSGSNYTYLSKIEFRQHFTSDKPLNYDEWSLSKSYIFSNNEDNIYYKSSGVKTQITTLSGYTQSVTTDYFYVNGKKYAHTYVAFIYNTNVNLTTNSYKHYVHCTMPKLGDGYIMTGGGDTPVETATVSVSLTNASCNIDTGTEYNVGSTVAIIATPNTGYTFTTAPKFNNANMSPVGDGSYFVNATITSNNSVTGSAVVIETVEITTNYAHCTDDVSVGYSVGDTANITLTCDDGYIFTDFPTINQSGIVLSFSLSEDFKKAYISFKVRGDFSIYGHAILSSENTYGFYAIYEPTDDFLKAFAKNHVYMIGAGTVTEYDLTPFIYNIYKLPFNVENYTNAETVSGVQFYKYTYNVPTKYIPDNGHIFTVDFGVINVPRQFNNDYDYDAQITLETPFFASVSLDANRVIGGSVHVVGTVNLYERTMYVDVYDKNGTCISESKQQIGYNFPIVTDTFKQTGAYSDELSNSLESARIAVNYDFAIAQISTLVGTVYADDVTLVGFTGTANEREQLESIIKGGINLDE